MHPADILALLPKELDRLKIISRYKEGIITQLEAARLLGLSERHMRRLIRRIERQGDAGILNKRRGKTPSNRLNDEIKSKALALIQEHFYDYGPTLAAEKLREYFQLSVSKETVRQWMFETHLWQAHMKKIPKPHPPRARREFLAELIQIDGSYHRWFEDRGPKCCLLVFIDDATSRIMNLRFCVAETTIDYLSTFKEYVLEHGIPRAIYFDKHNVFHINQRTAKSQDVVTQFGRVLKTLEIKLIYAHSPQAKGRVERANETLQDRLIKELRFHKI
ncbi:MAG TPA: ISNCY family transposase, partial [Candidatus Berkiella sp.]|nr:ISNCY family transposase [Candidatus Berkiella sp.]